MRFGIIGTNFVSGFFMDGARRVRECEVTAVCGSQEGKAKEFADKYQIPNYFTSYKEMYEAHCMDAVYIAVPNGLHYEMASFFLEKKMPVFCEKPLTSNFRQAKELFCLAKKQNVYLQEGLIPLYNPNYEILKQSLHLAGPLRQVNLNFSKYSSRYDAYLNGENPTTFQSKLANGAAMDLGVYLVAFCIGLFGKPKVILSTASLLDTGADVAGCSIFQYEGFSVSLSYSKASNTKNICEICGEWGQLYADQPSQPSRIQFVDRLTGAVTELGVEKKENFYYEIAEMIHQVKKGEIESKSVPFEISLTVHEVLTEVRRQSGIVFPEDKKQGV